MESASPNPSDEKFISQYVWELINRPRLVIRTSEGFVNTMPSGMLECNKPNPEIYLCHVTKGLLSIKAEKGGYFKVTETGITTTGTEPQFYEMELLDNTNMILRYGAFMFQAFQNGSYVVYNFFIFTFFFLSEYFAYSLYCVLGK